ncbi:hypothetical protein JANAI61_37290 [Jannaschia sp. AI_61]|uniref:hypothetical protein n=1 Tax=Jannaschia sp. AI_61 TaxID=2829796 RepID=UPI001BBA6914|nr:hypothetical protein [Jannaschia sp. AI_61]GIT93271.1 hypothetical protein JANAI61_37290 [Jannaschia sp. AI_61]
MTRRVLFHVGYHKTATTWMQRMLFTPAHGYAQIAGHGEADKFIMRPHGLVFDPSPMGDHIDRALAALPPDQTPVISSEILSGHPFEGGQGSDVLAERIAQIAPNARILISIRAQMRILPSVYMQYLLRGGTQRPAAFFAGTDEPGYLGFSPLHFEYDRLVAHYQGLFGVENVHVLTQESLRDDMDGAAARLATFAGNGAFGGLVPEARAVNAPSYPEYAVPVLRRVNQVQASTLNPAPLIRLGRTPKGLYKGLGYLLKRPLARRLLGQRRPVSDHVRDRFAGVFDASNQRLAELMAHQALDLSAYR